MQLYSSGIWLIGALLSFTLPGHSRDADPIEDFCSLSAHMMAEKDGMLYIMGGWMMYESKYGSYDGPNTVLRSVNVSNGFQTFPGSVDHIKREEVPGTIPPVANAAFFPTESGFDLTFGYWMPYNSTIYGERGPPVVNKKWQYGITARQWKETGITLKNWPRTNSSRQLSSSMTAWIPSLKKGFLFGGTILSINATGFSVNPLEEHSGLITYDQATNTWTNKTTPLGGIEDGALVHITTARDEVLIQFGGTSDGGTHVREFSKINIYSTSQSKWYTQNLPLGAVMPASRFGFCTALKSASDGSSHQIYIIGGREAASPVDVKGLTATSVWVLSIPTFEWANLPVTEKYTAANPRGRDSPKCQAIGEHYIFYYGGRGSWVHNGPTSCDRKEHAAFLLDVNTLTWTDEFTPNEGTYKIPPEVVRLIGGERSGGSTKKAPAQGWSHPDLGTIMTLTTTATAEDPSTSSPNGSGFPPKPNARAIAGGTVGGVAAVALGLLAGILWLRRQKRELKHPLTNERGVHSVELP